MGDGARLQIRSVRRGDPDVRALVDEKGDVVCEVRGVLAGGRARLELARLMAWAPELFEVLEGFASGEPGIHEKATELYAGLLQPLAPCPSCGGECYTPPCRTCDGSGVVDEDGDA